jgi:uncharacterized protein YqcC (DUF446 family)
MKLKEYFLPALFGFLLLLGGLWIKRFTILKLYYYDHWSKFSPEAELLKSEKAFFEDRQILSGHEIFRPSKGSQDAGPYLNSKIHWEIGEIHHQGSLVLPEYINKEMRKDWAIKKPLFKKMGLDFKWMNELHHYDHWNPEENSPVYPEGKKYQTYSFPVPTYKDLVSWAKLRLLYGKETKDIQNAFKDVRQLTRLIWTNDYLVSTSVASDLLNVEHEFHDTLLPEEEGEWKLIPEDDLMRAKRHFYALNSATDLRLSDEVFKKFTENAIGVCPMIVEGLMSYIAVREMIGEDLYSKYERMNNLVQGSQKLLCRRTIVHKMWEDPNWPSPMPDDQNAFSYITDTQILGKQRTWGEVKSDPDLKAIMGYILSSSPSRFSKAYEKVGP